MDQAGTVVVESSPAARAAASLHRTMCRRIRCAILFGLSFAAAAASATAAPTAMTADVPGTADLYAAGLPSGVRCCAGDSTPANSPVFIAIDLVAGQYLTFSTRGGAAHFPGETASPTADGDTSFFYSLTPDMGTGISGPQNVHLDGLGGVFLGRADPSGRAPAPLSGTGFGSISPGLDQIFFIGDGLTGTGSGTVQTFFIPTGATRLYLGILDDGGNYDNHGVITAAVTSSGSDVGSSSVPEPASGVLMVGGAVALAGSLGRRRPGLRERR